MMERASTPAEASRWGLAGSPANPCPGASGLTHERVQAPFTRSHMVSGACFVSTPKGRRALEARDGLLRRCSQRHVGALMGELTMAHWSDVHDDGLDVGDFGGPPLSQHIFLTFLGSYRDVMHGSPKGDDPLL